MKKLSILFSMVFIILLNSNSIFADDSNESEEIELKKEFRNNTWSIKKEKDDIKELRKDNKEKIKIERKKVKEDRRANREEAKENMKEFISTHIELRKEVSKSLTWSQIKNNLENLKKTFKQEIESQKELLKSTESFSWRLAILEKMETIRQNYFTARINEVKNNSWALLLFTERKNLFEENKALREKNIALVKKFHEDKTVLNILPKIEKLSDDDSKLSKLKDWINKLIAKYSLNTPSDTNTAILEKLSAIKAQIDLLISSNIDNNTDDLN